jgi:hypothetical protein
VNVAATTMDRPPILDDRALLGHPRGLGLLFVTEMWERFSFYAIRALLILYLVNALKWDTPSAANLYGTYTMSVYLTPLTGDWWNHHRARPLLAGVSRDAHVLRGSLAHRDRDGLLLA